MAQIKEKGEIQPKSALAQREEEILVFWKENEIFKKTLEKVSPSGDFVFYEGPPTANGKPGIHHLESRAFKDAIPRYKTMRGFHVERKAGWDTHGLPVELEVEKKLGLKSKREIEKYGIDKFNEECKKSVWTYVDDWEKFSERMAFWLDFKNPYITYTPDYIESIWSIVKTINEKNLLYKDYKVVPWCPRCGTALSSHELAQGYEDVKDLSVYVKFKIVGEDNLYLLAWTTTPWTLPGNVALAVGKDVDYVEIQIKNNESNKKENLILAKGRLDVVKDEYQIVRELKGKELLEKIYEPLYPFLKDNLTENQKDKLKNAFKVYEADFVTTEDGTGIVHTAVMYGQDDFELGTKVGLPKHHLVGEDGRFLAGTGIFSDRFVKDEAVAVDIIKDLAHRGLLFKKEKYEHSYPHCWRCKTPLIYFARDSWYIRMSSLKDKLIEENEKINWEPEHIKNGRFGEWLKDVKDWAISRERYWGTPLPLWVSNDGLDMEVIGSIEELKSKIGTRNSYIVFRHGEAENNIKNILSSNPDGEHHLTEKGRSDVAQVAHDLKNKKIDYIFASDFVRTKETVAIIEKILELPSKNIIFDKRLRETNFGSYNGRPREEAWKLFPNLEDQFEISYPDGENLYQVKQRVGDFLYETDAKYAGKNILIVSHEAPLWLLKAASQGYTIKELMRERPGNNDYIKNSELKNFSFVPLPHNSVYERDLHRPHIDDITFVSATGKLMKRIPEVMDVWFDSGAMPYASHNYPAQFERGMPLEGAKLPFPADYISEAIDQTRGWFYTLHAIGVLLDRGRAFKNVICLGHILDKDGQKMSKSRGNTLDPWEQIDKYGVDVLRYWMYTINQPGESKNFDERTVDEVVKKVFNLYLNVVKFYELYAPDGGVILENESQNPLDRWILSLLDTLHRDMTRYLDEYKPLEAARLIRDFIAELSQWYVRRSRDRFKKDDVVDKNNALGTLGFVLMESSKLMAPFMPFLSEDVYQRITKGKSKESVHLEEWQEPKISSAADALILSQMTEVRRIVSVALEARARVQIKIRQPLGLLTIKGDSEKLTPDLLEIIMDEVNVKDILFDKNLDTEVVLDVTITEELKKEGDMRELIRSIQEFRKDNNLSPGDPLDLVLSLTPIGRAMFDTFEQEIKSACGLRHIGFDALSREVEPWFSIRAKD